MQHTLAALALSMVITTPAFAANAPITTQEILQAQQAWADGIVAISKTYVEKGDFKARAAQHVKDLYAYDQGKVLFKPTLAVEDKFRETYDQALSYFVGGSVKEDKGFAIKPWAKVRFGEQEIITDSDSAIAMGNYYFTPYGDTKEVKVQYTFGYIRDQGGKLRINVHHSSLPVSG
jgi:hypothetical protein